VEERSSRGRVEGEGGIKEGEWKGQRSTIAPRFGLNQSLVGSGRNKGLSYPGQ